MTKPMPVRAYLLLLLPLALAAILAGCPTATPPTPSVKDAGSPPSRLRLLLISNVSGGLEPCGCTEDQLGGLDHLAALQQSLSKDAASLLLGAGPMLFLGPKLSPDRQDQDKWKAEAIAASLKDLGLVAWAPGANDWAAGPAELQRLAASTGASLLAANLSDKPLTAGLVREVGGLKIGIFGLSDPKDALGSYPAGLKPSATSAPDLAKQQLAALKQQGARLFIGLLAMPRGAALRIADAVPELHLLLLGKPVATGDLTEPQPVPQLLGSTLVVETANHGQTVAVVDLVVVDSGTAAIKLSDAGGIERAAKINELSRRIRELEQRINDWERGGKVDPKDLAARKADLKKALIERQALQKPPPPPAGSYFSYAVHEVREELGVDPAVAQRLLAYYRRVNEHNKQVFADLRPPPAAQGQSSYIGVAKCAECHEEEKKVWDQTDHARAYQTLVKQAKEFNLDCVGCHVTGYGKPGGSTVTYVAELKDVQCEICHGPGSRHADVPEDPSLLIVKPDPAACAETCHHPPHVEGFDPDVKLDKILAPGHGKPAEPGPDGGQPPAPSTASGGPLKAPP